MYQELHTNEDGNIIKEITERPDGSASTSEYNAEGNLISEKATTTDGVYREFYYNDNGVCVLEIAQLPDGTYIEDHYDENGNFIERISSAENVQVEIDTDVDVIEGNDVENEPMPKENTEMFCDENGNIIKEIYTDTDGSVYTHEYDSEGNHIFESSSMADGSYHEFRYDAEGNIIDEVHR